MRAQAVLRTVLQGMLMLSSLARGDATAPRVPDADHDQSAEVERMLRAAQMRMDPNREIAAAVARCDELLDENPRNGKVWLVLARALAIGFAQSKHAQTPLDARRQAAALDPDDCHLAALVARGELSDGKSPTLARWIDRPAACAEMLYLEALRDRAHELERLTRSRQLQPSAEALVALGAAQLRRNRIPDAVEAYHAAVDAAPLFGEDWRMDGWIAVHANLGLAVAYARQHQPQKARAAFKAAKIYLDDPGPWHDLSDEERRWAKDVLHHDVR